MSILLSFLELLLYIAIIILIAFGIKWVIEGFMKWTIDPDVLKWAKVVVGLLCIIAVVVWVSGLMGGGVSLPRFLH